MTQVRRTVLQRSDAGPPLVNYTAMSRDELVDHFIDENGLAHFIDVQMAGTDPQAWDWRLITRDLQAFCPYLTFSPEYLQELYAMQKSRESFDVVRHGDRPDGGSWRIQIDQRSAGEEAAA